MTISFCILTLRVRQGGFALFWRYAHGKRMGMAGNGQPLAMQLEVCINLVRFVFLSVSARGGVLPLTEKCPARVVGANGNMGPHATPVAVLSQPCSPYEKRLPRTLAVVWFEPNTTGHAFRMSGVFFAVPPYYWTSLRVKTLRQLSVYEVRRI